jgi:hypothetical protein
MSRVQMETKRETNLRNRRLGLALAFLTLSYIGAIIVFLIVK